MYFFKKKKIAFIILYLDTLTWTFKADNTLTCLVKGVYIWIFFVYI